jgi:hypothetical protein
MEGRGQFHWTLRNFYWKEWTIWQCCLTIFEQFCDRGCCGKILNETYCCAQHVKNSAGRIGYKHFMVNELQTVTVKMRILALFMIMCMVLKYGLIICA